MNNLFKKKEKRTCWSIRISKLNYFTFQGWQDIMKLSVEFADPFVALPDNISRNLDAWQEVWSINQLQTAVNDVKFSFYIFKL